MIESDEEYVTTESIPDADFAAMSESVTAFDVSIDVCASVSTLGLAVSGLTGTG